MLRGTEFEFRHRFWLILLIFFLAFGSYAVEPIDSVAWVLRRLGDSSPVSVAFPQAAVAHAIFAIGAILVGVAAWLRTWGTAYLNANVVRDSAIHGERLVAGGPYRYVRNPLYIGTMLVAVGLAPMAPPIGCLVIVAGMGLLVLRLIGCEEAFLVSKQGDAYRAYFERVPRLWPALRPRLPAGGAKPRWGQAWAGELWMWIIFMGAAVFAFTFNAKLFDVIVWSGLALYFIFRMAARRRAESRPA